MFIIFDSQSTLLLFVNLKIKMLENNKLEIILLSLTQQKPLMDLNLNKINPLNWSILISGGKENNHDFLSNGEWKGKTLKPKPRICVAGMQHKDVVW